MTNGSKVLAGEFFVAILFTSWGAIKFKYAPWPGNYVKVGIAFGILAILSMANERLAALLGAGFMIAILVRDLSKGDIMTRPNLPQWAASQDPPFKPTSLDGTRPEAPWVPLWFG